VVRDVLGLSSKKLRAYLVWVPMVDGDSAEAARLEASLYPDSRISHYWDPDGKLAAELGPRLGLGERKAWDVYLVFERRAKWGSLPSLWMHQLDGVKATWLDSVKLRGKVEELLR
jgi:hypothetical protein